MGGDQLAHARVAGPARTAAEHDGDDAARAALDRGDEIEARGARIAGLDAVHALDPAEQVVVVAHGAAAIDEAREREVAVVLREALLDRDAEQRLVARRGHLLVVGKPDALR